ncbi:MAG: hypothetical protein GY820_41275 [Gammaproteobacteria bacterium]|nr:hypothetical protein [Gammaproteobacteria bacterium]
MKRQIRMQNLKARERKSEVGEEEYDTETGFTPPCCLETLNFDNCRLPCLRGAIPL